MSTPVLGDIAKQALAEALGKVLSTPAASSEQPSPSEQPDLLPELTITGPINRVMELEGKRYALDFVNALGHSIAKEQVRTEAIAKLTRYAASKPASLASGVKVVIDILRAVQ